MRSYRWFLNTRYEISSYKQFGNVTLVVGYMARFKTKININLFAVLTYKPPLCRCGMNNKRICMFWKVLGVLNYISFWIFPDKISFLLPFKIRVKILLYSFKCTVALFTNISKWNTITVGVPAVRKDIHWKYLLSYFFNMIVLFQFV